MTNIEKNNVFLVRKWLIMKKRALIIIDVQRGLFEKKNEVYKSTELIPNINSIIDIFRKEQENIILVQHCNNGSLKKDSTSW
jgi:nicotinamidase-related amidase